MFFIIEQGSKIQTPIDRLLRNSGVPIVGKSSATGAVSPNFVNSQTQSVLGSQHRPYKQGSLEETSPNPVTFAEQVMSSPVITASVEQPLQSIWALFASKGIHHLPLLDRHHVLQGIVSDRDLLRYAANNQRDVSNTPIQQLMTRHVISAARDTEIRTLAEVMCQQRIGAIPIIGEPIEIVGIVTRTDILRALVHGRPLELWA